MSNLKNILATAAISLVAASAFSVSLEKAGFGDQYMDPGAVSNIVNTMVVNATIDEEQLSNTVSAAAAGIIDSEAMDRKIQNALDDSGFLKSEQVVALMHGETIDVEVGLNTNAVEDVAAYTVSNTVADVALTGDYNDLINKPTDFGVIGGLIDDAFESNRLEFTSYNIAAHSNMIRAVEFAALVETNVVGMYADMSDYVDNVYSNLESTYKSDLGRSISNYVDSVVVSSIVENPSVYLAGEPIIDKLYDRYVMTLKIYPSIRPTDLEHQTYVFTNYVQHGELLVKVIAPRATFIDMFYAPVNTNAISNQSKVYSVLMTTLELVETQPGVVSTNELTRLKEAYVIKSWMQATTNASNPGSIYAPCGTGIIQYDGSYVTSKSPIDMALWNSRTSNGNAYYMGRDLLLFSNSLTTENQPLFGSSHVVGVALQKAAEYGEYLFIGCSSVDSIFKGGTADALRGTTVAAANSMLGVDISNTQDDFFYFTMYGVALGNNSSSLKYEKPTTITGNITPNYAVCIQQNYGTPNTRVTVDGFGRVASYVVPYTQLSSVVTSNQVESMIQRALGNQ